MIPLSREHDPLEITGEVIQTFDTFFLEVVALVSGVESIDVILLIDLKVVQDDDHSNRYLLLVIVQKKHEVDFEIADGVAKSRSVF
jgi:hypothetical protein